MKNALVITTIRVPHNLEAYAKDIAENGPNYTTIIVAGDRKSPDRESMEFCDNLLLKYNVPVMWMGAEQQENFFRNYHEYKKYGEFLPWNCVQRRNVAILAAYRLGAEIIATIDDDNLWEGNGYFEQHDLHGQVCTHDVYASDTGWFNALVNERCYPRGFSFKERGKLFNEKRKQINGRIVVNAGLWIGDPDIDAVTRLALKPTIEGDYFEGRLTLDLHTKCPFNSQNTALHRDVIPAYCLATGLGRYDDIVAGYIVKRIADHLGDYISFGRPIVRQVRNEHDLYRDLEDELTGMKIIDRFVENLYETRLTGTTYKKCAAELMIGLSTMQAPDGEQLDFVKSVIKNYSLWLEMFP